ncbi:MAG: hypothetical protein SAMD01599839_03840 [Rectinema sp.]
MRSEQKKEPRGENPGPGHRRMFLRAIALFVCAATFALAFSGCELFPKNASTLGGNKYAVVVGIDDYINSGVNDLHYCVADAESMKKMLEDAGWTVNLITAESDESKNQYATKTKIEAALATVPADTTTFLFYYSGHGSIDYSDDASYIVPSDYDGSTYSSMISATEFSGWLDSVTATNKSVILDSCYSGGFVDAGDSVDAVPGDSVSMQTSTAADMFFRFGELLAQNAEASSTNPSTAPLVISAAGWAEESQESPSYGGGHGIFTFYFLQAADTNSSGTMKGDSDGDNVLSCIETYNYAKNKLASDSSIPQSELFLPHITGGLRDFALIDKR